MVSTYLILPKYAKAEFPSLPDCVLYSFLVNCSIHGFPTQAEMVGTTMIEERNLSFSSIILQESYLH